MLYKNNNNKLIIIEKQKLPDQLTKVLTTLSAQGMVPSKLIPAIKIYSQRVDGKEISTEEARIILNKFTDAQRLGQSSLEKDYSTKEKDQLVMFNDYNFFLSKYNINKKVPLTKQEFKNSIWAGEHLTAARIVLVVVMIFLIALVNVMVKNWNSIDSGGIIMISIFIYIPFGLIIFIILKSFYKKFLKTIDLDNEYEKYCVKEEKRNEWYLEYELLREIRKSFIDPKSLDINKIKSAIKFLKSTNESDDYFIVYGMILQSDKKFKEAINIFKKVYSKEDQNVAFRLIADSYFSLKEYENALSYYNKYFTFDLRDKSIVDSMISSCHTLIKLQKS